MRAGEGLVMSGEGDHVRYGLPLARDVLARLRAGERPTAR
jgi:hypothetical protein